jgi:aspartate aminotransferase
LRSLTNRPIAPRVVVGTLTTTDENEDMNLSKRVQSIGESPTLAVSAKAAKMRSEGIDVVGFGAGEPDFPTPAHVIAAAEKAMADGLTKYSKPASGQPIVKEAICGKLKRENGLDYAPDQVVVTAGGKMAGNLLMQALIDPGDEVIIPVPYWVSYPEFVKLAGGVPVYVEGNEANGFCVTPDQIQAAITDRTKVMLINYPSNPAGHMYTPDQVRALAKVVEGTDVTVLSDEIYDRLILDGQPFLSFAAASDDAYRRTITMNSASKTYSMTGWRIGFIAGDRTIVKSVAKLQSQGTSGAATFTQIAYAAALSGDQSCVDEMRKAFAERAGYMHAKLNAMPGVRCPKPEGAFYAFPSVGDTFAGLGVDSSFAFAEKLLAEAEVAVVPGGAFGMDANVRLSFASSMENIEKGLSRILRFVSSQ